MLQGQLGLHLSLSGAPPIEDRDGLAHFMLCVVGDPVGHACLWRPAVQLLRQKSYFVIQVSVRVSDIYKGVRALASLCLYVRCCPVQNRCGRL
jgi:hypothetical protein